MSIDEVALGANRVARHAIVPPNVFVRVEQRELRRRPRVVAVVRGTRLVVVRLVGRVPHVAEGENCLDCLGYQQNISG